MVIFPDYDDYNINYLIVLGNQTTDIFVRNEIKSSIVRKILQMGKPLFFLINNFMKIDNILKEAYADAIMICMKDNNYKIQDNIVDEILRYASLDTLMYYGADSGSLDFSRRCKEEFDNRAKLIEDKVELNRKKNLDKMIKTKIFVKRKGVRK